MHQAPVTHPCDAVNAGRSGQAALYAAATFDTFTTSTRGERDSEKPEHEQTGKHDV